MEFVEYITENTKNVLLVEPNFPIPNKSRNHSNFLPIGLLKIAAYLKTKNINVKLIRFEENKDEGHVQSSFDAPHEKEDEFYPDLICVTSIFTYWSEHVKKAVYYYKNKFKEVPIIVGGVYASLMPEHCKKNTQCDDVILGPIPEVENLNPDYSLVDVDYQIIHTSRGCIRKCGFCGTYVIEPDWRCKKSIKDEIVEKKLIFYDNNLLANQHIENILNELIELKKEKKISYLESQSGFDGRILRKKPHLARMLKEAGFKNPKIAWDYGIKQAPQIKKQIDMLIEAGFQAKEISIFMIYNYEPPYEEMEEKRVKCAEWGVQITDCRYRPLNATFDNYSSYKREQGPEDYYIHEEMGWTDAKIRKFRRNIRRHNICMRHEVDYHSTILERKQIPQEEAKELREKKFKEIKEKYSEILPDAWSPLDNHPWNEQDYFKKNTLKN